MKSEIELFHTDLDVATAERFATASKLAWDIETSGLDPMKDRISTVQLHSSGIGTAIVQVDQRPRPHNLCKLLENPVLLKVFHHAMFDLRFMVAHWQVEPSTIACTKVASKLLWPGKRHDGHTLKVLLAEQLGVIISKEQRMSNWSAAQLSPAQISYASGDVEHLLPLLDCLEYQLEAVGLRDDYQACLDFLPIRVRLDLGNWPDVFGY